MGIIHKEGASFIANVLAGEQALPSKLYLGVCDEVLAATDGLADITTEPDFGSVSYDALNYTTNGDEVAAADSASLRWSSGKLVCAFRFQANDTKWWFWQYINKWVTMEGMKNYAVVGRNDGTLSFEYAYDDMGMPMTRTVVDTSDWTPTQDTLHEIMVVADTTADEIRFYADGSLLAAVANDFSTYAPMDPGEGPLYIGRDANNNNQWPHGKIAGVYIGTTEPADHLFPTSAPAGSKLYYAMDEGSGTSLTDGSGNSNTGTISGPDWTTVGVAAGYSRTPLVRGTDITSTLDESGSPLGYVLNFTDGSFEADGGNITFTRWFIATTPQAGGTLLFSSDCTETTITDGNTGSLPADAQVMVPYGSG